MRSDFRRHRGFTLIEVLVAFAVFALSVGAIFEVFAGASRRAGKAARRDAMYLTAQSLVSQLRVRPAPWPEEAAGQTRSEQWKVRVAPYEVAGDGAFPWRAYLVTVSVADGKSRDEISLESVELARRVR